MDVVTIWIMAISSILNFLLPMTAAVDSDCDFYQTLVMGQEYYIYNKEYREYYKGKQTCRWIGESIQGTKIVISCEDIHLPESPNCSGDRLRISLTGNADFADSNNYCGTGSVSLISKGNQIAVGLFAETTGRFLCTLTAVLDSQGGGNFIPSPNPVCDCGWEKSTRIVGGVETKVNQYPYMAGLIDVARRELYCGGSIISNRYVLTAAHCVYGRSAAGIGVLVGDHNLTTGSDTTSTALYQVAAFEYHPQFNVTTQINDIAILRTSRAISFSANVGPVCLPFRYTTIDFDGQLVTALGWGQTEYTGPKSDVLMKVALRVTSVPYCIQSYPQDIITSNQICTFASGKDTCQSDSGGPLLWKDLEKLRNQLVGIISYGFSCASSRPGVNTRVTSYITWIVSRTTDASYCIQ